MNNAPFLSQKLESICENINTRPTRAIEIDNGSRADSCPDGVVAYHEALSRLRPGFKSRSGRHSIWLIILGVVASDEESIVNEIRWNQEYRAKNFYPCFVLAGEDFQ